MSKQRFSRPDKSLKPRSCVPRTWSSALSAKEHRPKKPTPKPWSDRLPQSESHPQFLPCPDPRPVLNSSPRRDRPRLLNSSRLLLDRRMPPRLGQHRRTNLPTRVRRFWKIPANRCRSAINVETHSISAVNVRNAARPKDQLGPQPRQREEDRPLPRQRLSRRQPLNARPS